MKAIGANQLKNRTRKFCQILLLNNLKQTGSFSKFLCCPASDSWRNWHKL